jgi:hypothetical protein
MKSHLNGTELAMQGKIKRIPSGPRLLGLVLATVAIAIAAGTASASKGGKGGGGSTDPCTTTASFFPALGHQVTSSGGRKRTRTLVLASADGSCERTLHSFPVQFGLPWGRMQLHVEVNGQGQATSGFVIWTDSTSSGEFHRLETKVLDFTVGTGNSVTPKSTGPRTIATTEWNTLSNTGRRFHADPRLSPDGERLLISAYVASTHSDGVNQVWQCDPRSTSCEQPEVLLEIEDPNGVFSDLGEALWEVAPSADPARFFAILVGENNSSFGIHLTERDGAGQWQIAANPLYTSGGFIGGLDAHPWNPNRLVWSGSGVTACVIDGGTCGAGTWTISDASTPLWSRRGRLADPHSNRASLYHLVPGSASVREVYDDGATSLSASFSGFSGPDAY